VSPNLPDTGGVFLPVVAGVATLLYVKLCRSGQWHISPT
jgi:hypothetical protein